MNLKEFLRPTKWKIITFLIIFIIMILVSGIFMKHPSTACSYEPDLKCSDYNSPKIGFPAFYYEYATEGDVIFIYWSWTNLIINLIWSYLLSSIIINTKK